MCILSAHTGAIGCTGFKFVLSSAASDLTLRAAAHSICLMFPEHIHDLHVSLHGYDTLISGTTRIEEFGKI